jgi:cell pole-organizing protein PopZ
MEEILASIRRIIADDENTKPAAKPAPAPQAAPKPAPAPRAAPPPPPPPPAPPSMNQSEVDAMLARLDATPGGDAEPQQHDILDLTEQMAEPEAETEPPSFQTIDGQNDVIFTDAPPPPPEPLRMADEEPRRPQAPPAADHSLLSSAASAAVDSAFNALAHTVLVQNARTLEDLVREMLRPLLKTWLDDNLPSLVERLVRAEIERVSRGRNNN